MLATLALDSHRTLLSMQDFEADVIFSFKTKEALASALKLVPAEVLSDVPSGIIDYNLSLILRANVHV